MTTQSDNQCQIDVSIPGQNIEITDIFSSVLLAIYFDIFSRKS